MSIGEKTKGCIRVGKDKNYVVNEEVYIVRGVILDNPFVKRIENGEAIFWMLRNQRKVQAVIAQRFKEQGVIGGVVSDCFNTLLNNFVTREELTFNKNYFGKNTEYTVGEYVLNRVKYAVKQYKKTISKDVGKGVPLLTSKEVESYIGIADEVIAGDLTVEDVIERDFGYWDALFEDLVSKFEVFLRKRIYKTLDYELVIANLYFNVVERNELELEKHYKEVAENSKESLEVITTIVEDMSKAVKEGDELGNNILRVIQELLRGISYGWRPEVVRNLKR